MQAPQSAPQAATVPFNANEPIIWDKLIAAGFKPIHVAAMMGNFRQESNYNTADQAGGLGIAQWLGNRRQELIAKGNHLDINVQVQHVIDELNTTETAAKNYTIYTASVDHATIAFMRYYERCNPTYCHADKRVQYAHDVYARYAQN